MPAPAVKRKKASRSPKIHVKGLIPFPDPDKEDVDVKEVKAESDEESGEEDVGTRALQPDHDENSDDSDKDEDIVDESGDDEEDGSRNKIKSQKERKDEKMASKMKSKERTEQRNGRTIFVGNLPSACEPRELRKHFASCGPIESVRLRGIIPSNPKIPKKAAAIRKSIHETCKSIFGYVVFWDPDSVVKALELNTTKIGDNYITVQRVGSKTFENDVTVFIGNLPLNVQENSVREFFDECGRIQGVRLIRDSKTGIGKGFGFISFGTRDGVILALEKNGAEFEGRELRIRKAGKETEKRDKQSRKLDSKNARRRLRDSKGGKKSKGSADRNDEPAGGLEAEDGGESVAVQVNKKKKEKATKTETKIKFLGKRTGKSVTRKKTKQKLLKGRRSAGKKKTIARLLTA